MRTRAAAEKEQTDREADRHVIAVSGDYCKKLHETRPNYVSRIEKRKTICPIRNIDRHNERTQTRSNDEKPRTTLLRELRTDAEAQRAQ